MSQPLFHWCTILQDIPESPVEKNDRGVILDLLPFASIYQEQGFTIEVFRNGETIDVISVPQSWVNILPAKWGETIHQAQFSTTSKAS